MGENHLKIQYNTIPLFSAKARMAPGRSVVELTLDDLASCDDAARTVERGSSNAARGCAQLPGALPDAAAMPVLAIQQEAGQPAQGEAPAATTSSQAAAGASALSV